MIDPRVLKYFGTSNEQLRTFFTAPPAGKGPDGKDSPASPLHAKKDEFVKWVSGLMEDGRRHCFKNYRHFAAVDLMNDSQPTVPENVPLMAYAQGKISIERVVKELTTLNCASEFIEQVNVQNPSTKEMEVKPQVNLPRLQEVCVNIARSLIGKRVNAQSNKYNSLRPAFRYDPRGTSMVDHLRGEVMSQYADDMADAFGYKHEQTQCIRGMLNYRTVQFPAGAWEVEPQIQIAPDDFAGVTEEMEIDGKKLRLRTQIVREGVKFVRPNPARVLYDTSQPLASLNTDTGCRWVGFWDVMRYGDLQKNPSFFNTERVTWTSSGISVIDQNRAFFDLVFQGQPINFPTNPNAVNGTVDLAAANDRTSNAFLYSMTTDGDKAVFITDMRLKVIPKDWGMGTYPHPVWLRVLVGNWDTVVFAEWLPSRPAIYWGYGEDDTRLINIAQSHEIMPWQDQLSNIFSQLLMKMKHSLLRVIVLNTDVFPAGSKIVEEFRKALDSPGYYINPHLLEVSFKGMEELQLDITKIFTVIGPREANETEFINNAFKAIVQILGILERLLNLSPQEQGQPMPREASAEEIAALESSTQVTYNAISAAIDEARAAWKQIIYESTMAHASDQIYLPVSQRFSEETIKAAGFEIVKDPAPESQGSAAKKGHTVIGTKSLLQHNYIFTSRDGGDRYTNQQSANALISLLGQVIPLIGPEAFGKERIFAIINEIFRLLSAYDLKLTMNEGEGDNLMAPKVEETLQKLVEAIQEEAKTSQEHEQEITGLMEAIKKIEAVLQEMGEQLQQAQAPPVPAAA